MREQQNKKKRGTNEHQRPSAMSSTMVEHQYPNSPHPVRHHDDMSKDVPQHQTSHSLQCSEQCTL